MQKTYTDITELYNSHSYRTAAMQLFVQWEKVSLRKCVHLKLLDVYTPILSHSVITNAIYLQLEISSLESSTSNNTTFPQHSVVQKLKAPTRSTYSSQIIELYQHFVI